MPACAQETVSAFSIPIPVHGPAESRTLRLQPSQVTVLVVEDEPDIRYTVCESLHISGYRSSVEVGTVEGALELLSSGLRPNVILLDLRMPNMDGRHLLATLQADREFGKIPVVVMTATAGAQVPGAKCILHKPFSINAMLDAIDTYAR